MRARDSVFVLFAGLACGGSPMLVEVTGGEGCPEIGLDDDSGVTRRCVAKSIQLTDARSVDVLFVIDDGPEAGALQMRFAEAMEDFAGSVALIDPAPDLRIAFTRARDANPGCGGSSGRVELESCREHPETFVAADGTDRFAELCEVRCELDELATSQPWIERTHDTTNLAEGTALADALRCASLLGVSGCPFPAPLSATRSAFLRSEQDIEAGEAGFFRPEATPIIVWVTSGAECSLGPAGLEAFDASGERELWTDPELATVGLCWNAGVTCTRPDESGAMTCKAANIDGVGRETGSDNAVLQPIAELASFLEDVVTARRAYNPNADVHVFAITGVPSDGMDGSPPVFAPVDEMTAAHYGVQPTCTLGDDAMIPPIRLAAFRALAQEHDLAEPELFSACTDDFAPALAHVTAAIEGALRPTCMPACVADVDTQTEGLQISCNLVVQTQRVDGGIDERNLVACDSASGGAPVIPAGEPGCHAARTGLDMHPTCIAEGWNVEFDVIWNGPKPPGTLVFATCELSLDKQVDCPAL